jgi:NAD(P)H-nitrite reductase large subunit
MAKQYLLIGASAASIGALNALLRLDPHGQITIISAESELPYNKCLLADYMGGTIEAERLSIAATNQVQCTWVLGQKVTSINSATKQVVTDSGSYYSYDELFLGMGSSPWMPEIPGIKSAGIFTFHTHADTKNILLFVKERAVKKVTVIGAGLSGLEAADALLKHNLTITIIEKNEQVLPWILSKDSAAFLHKKIQEHGVQLVCNQSVIKFTESEGIVTGVHLDNGSVIPTDLVIVATGLRPNISLCGKAGITLGRYGVVVNEFLQTSTPHIYAGGDLIEVKNLLTGSLMRSCLWPDAMQQGMLAAHAMAGKPRAYHGANIITSSAFFGVKFAQAGILERHDSSLSLHRTQGVDFCHTYALKDGILGGFEVVGTRHNLGDLRRFLLTKQPVSIDQMSVCE